MSFKIFECKRGSGGHYCSNTSPGSKEGILFFLSFFVCVSQELYIHDSAGKEVFSDFVQEFVSSA